MDKKKCDSLASVTVRIIPINRWWYILGDKHISNFKSMRNAHARIISVSVRYRQMLFAPNYKEYFHWATGKKYFIYLFHFYLKKQLIT